MVATMPHGGHVDVNVNPKLYALVPVNARRGAGASPSGREPMRVKRND
ncbi:MULTISPECIES: hypothetical protein [unclassified Mesorhizobium]|nr:MULTISPECIES: hypothetical protein [unclassified Mesorhizobium]